MSAKHPGAPTRARQALVGREEVCSTAPNIAAGGGTRASTDRKRRRDRGKRVPRQSCAVARTTAPRSGTSRFISTFTRRPAPWPMRNLFKEARARRPRRRRERARASRPATCRVSFPRVARVRRDHGRPQLAGRPTRTSSSTPSAPDAAASSNAAIVFSGASPRTPRCPKMNGGAPSGGGRRRHRSSARLIDERAPPFVKKRHHFSTEDDGLIVISAVRDGIPMPEGMD